MPELPEVETIRTDLEPHVVGRTFARVVVEDAKAVERPAVKEFIKGLKGRRVDSMRRRGKYLIFALDNGRSLIAHMRMTGNMMVAGRGTKPVEAGTQRVRATFTLDNGSTVSFVDRRRLGRLWLVDRAEEIVGSLGIEPLSNEFTPEALTALLRSRSAPIKAVLCDQEVLAGVGNMYADEALFEARIHPLTPANRISAARIRKLHGAIRHVLMAAIDGKGASVDTYFRPNGDRGAAHYEFKVAHRRGKTCPECGGPVERIPVRGRGTYFCPRCQKRGR